MKWTLTLISIYPEQNIMKLHETDVDNEKYVLLQKFHVSSTTGFVNIWYCFVVGVTRFGLSNAISLVSHFGRGDGTTQKDRKRANEYIYSNISGLNKCCVNH
jgi:hypothetical protein